MIEKSQKRESSSSMKTIYLITVASMFGAAVPYFWKSLRQGDSYVMKVNGVGISTTEFMYNIYKERTLLNILRERSGVYYAQMLQMLGKTEQVESSVAEHLIIQKLVIWFGHRLQLSLSPKFVAHELRNPQVAMSVLGEFVPPYIFTEQGLLNYARLNEYLSRQGLTMEQFETMLDDQLFIVEVIQLLRGAGVLSQSGRTLALTEQLSSRTIAIELFPLQPLIEAERQKTDQSPSELQAFFEEQNRLVRRYWSSELRSGTVWTFEGEQYLKRQVEQESNEGNNETREQKFERLFHIETDQILLGNNKDAFRRFIEESIGKKRELKKVAYGSELRDPLVAALFDLKNIGESVAVVQGMKGYIIQLDDISHPQERSFDQVVNKVREDYLAEKARIQLKDIIIGKGSAKAVDTTMKRVVIAPHQSALPEEELGLYGIKISDITGLVIQGQEASGIGQKGGYRAVAEDISAYSEDLIKQAGGIEKLYLRLDHNAAELVARQFIASLRNHAILSDVRLGRNEQ